MNKNEKWKEKVFLVKFNVYFMLFFFLFPLSSLCFAWANHNLIPLVWIRDTNRQKEEKKPPWKAKPNFITWFACNIPITLWNWNVWVAWERERKRWIEIARKKSKKICTQHSPWYGFVAVWLAQIKSLKHKIPSTVTAKTLGKQHRNRINVRAKESRKQQQQPKKKRRKAHTTEFDWGKDKLKRENFKL